MLKAGGLEPRPGCRIIHFDLQRSLYYVVITTADMLLDSPPERWIMDGRGVEELREELGRLMREHIESLNQQTFGGLNDELLLQQEERLKRIREVSADFLAALKRERT